MWLLRVSTGNGVLSVASVCLFLCSFRLPAPMVMMMMDSDGDTVQEVIMDPLLSPSITGFLRPSQRNVVIGGVRRELQLGWGVLFLQRKGG